MRAVREKLSALACPYEIIRRRGAKRLILRFSQYGKLTVVIPYHCDSTFISHSLNHFQDWIGDRLEDFRYKQQQQPDLFQPVPDVIHLQGIEKQWRLLFSDKPEKPHDYFFVGDHSIQHRIVETEPLQRKLRNWIRQTAKKHLHTVMLELAEKTGLDYTSISIRNQKTKWGSCSSGGRISLNQNLLFLPPRLLQYLCIHELCHTVHMHHREPFWDLVKHHEPDCMELDRMINSRLWIPRWAGEAR